MAEIAGRNERTWDDPKQLAYIHSVIVNCAQERRRAFVRHIDERQYDAGAGAYALAERMRDPCLQEGIVALYENWEAIGDSVLTPQDERKPVHISSSTINGSMGAACLAAKFSGQPLELEFNGDVIKVGVDDTPLDLRDQWYIRQREMRQFHLAATGLSALSINP